MHDPTLKHSLSLEERLLFSRLDALVTPMSQTEAHDLTLAIDQTRGAFHYIQRFKNVPPEGDWAGIVEVCRELRTAMEAVHSIMGRSALIGHGSVIPKGRLQ